MSSSLTDAIQERVRSLPLEQQEEVLEFVDGLKRSSEIERSPSLTAWLREARQLRVRLPETSDSVEILRHLREERSCQ
jgi:hypothetical protein